MKTVKEVSRLTGVSVRTLHHYDAIGLLSPSKVTQAGYRLYDDEALARLQTILLFRELEFPLREIKTILDTPGFDPMAALTDQIRLLELRREHLDRLIDHAKTIQKTGVMTMSYKAYDKKKLDSYAAEAKARWGNTEAYQEFEQRGRKDSDAADALMEIFARMGAIRTADPACPEAQSLVRELQDHITANYYTCTKQILRGLGQMYVAGGEMTENIDKAGGEGTAAFAHKAIEVYCA